MTDVYSANHVFLVGHIASDIETGKTKHQALSAKFRLATNELFFKRGADKATQNVEYHPIVAWGERAGQIKKWGFKGKSMIITGKLRHRSYTSVDGTSKTTTYVEVDTFTWLGKKSDFEEEFSDEEENKDPI